MAAGLQNRRLTLRWFEPNTCPFCWLEEAAATKTTLSAATQRLKALQVLLSRHIAAISGCLVSPATGNAALRSPTSADAPEQPVLDVRNQPDSHRPRRTEQRFLRQAQLKSSPCLENADEAHPGRLGGQRLNVAPRRWPARQ